MVTAGDLACAAMTRISRLKYFYEDLAEGAVMTEEHHLGKVSDEVMAEAVEMVKRGMRYLAERIEANRGEY